MAAADRGGTREMYSMVFYGYCERVRHGKIYRRAIRRDQPVTGAFRNGVEMGHLTGSAQRYWMI